MKAAAYTQYGFPDVVQIINVEKPGDVVFGTCRGALAEYACASESALIAKPENLTLEAVASVPVAALTALQGLRGRGQMPPGSVPRLSG